ncbi:MAG: RnfABCDGE type electron transport complex subunit D [Patescibacteria group bacterium]|nr:RnfABCDGE type electron transport complex subunit D [Patescibacteria group bacterium]MDE2015312.1 RnfABCDGE type electron transport complex subunit D [Patescibacteria group bacterium]MDE2227117.1 RnfABCDGE type electron transport complex subunit D [Patescibacteria group bacterium]
MLKSIDNILNRITMYRVVLYYLLALWGIALAFSFFGILPYNPLAMTFSAAFIVAICWSANNIFSRIFEAPTNVESIFITALILALIITPLKSLADTGGMMFLFWASVWAMASKYILAIKKKHIFNPAGFAVALTALTIGSSATWWVGGTLQMMPFVLAGGLLLVRKIQRFDLSIAFFLSAMVSILWTGVSPLSGPLDVMYKALVHAPIFFFAFVMITEPLTTPPTKITRILYGIFTGLLFAPAIHIGSIYSTPELALLCGNAFSYLLSPKSKFILQLKNKERMSTDVYDFVFTPNQKLSFRPGQYLEWTLPHEGSDSRGNRRYFTIASSPTEKELRVGVKFYPQPSSFKKSLFSMGADKKIVGAQLSGDFVLPRNKNRKLALIAGGIGITPFRSMVKYLLDKNEKRDIALFYSNKTADDIIYRDVFDEAERRLGIRTVYTVTDTQSAPREGKIRKGRISPEILMKALPDYSERMFYLSGPRSMVVAFEETLKALGVKKRKIKTDFFPGFA